VLVHDDTRRWRTVLQELSDSAAENVTWQRAGAGDRLELLGTGPALDACRAVLRHAGFSELADWCFRLDPSGVLVVRLVQVSGWGLPPAELAALVDGQGVMELAPDHVLLLAAQRLAAGGAAGSEVTVGRVRQVSRDDAGVGPSPAALRRLGRRAGS